MYPYRLTIYCARCLRLAMGFWRCFPDSNSRPLLLDSWPRQWHGVLTRYFHIYMYVYRCIPFGYLT